MTKKHFIMIAKAIHTNLDRSCDIERWRLETLALDLCEDFYSINPRFDRQTFLVACGFDNYRN